MEREWWIQIDGHQEGPYHIVELEGDPRLTAETLVWKKGFQAWVPLAAVDELRRLLGRKEKPAAKPVEEEEEGRKEGREERFKTRITPDGLVIEARRDPPNFLLWLIVAILLGMYLAYKFWS